MAFTGAVQTPQKRPDPRQPSRRVSQACLVSLPAGLSTVQGLARTRALGAPSLQGAPGNLVQVRALGDPSVSKTLPPRVVRVRDVSALIGRRAAPGDSRSIFFLQAALGKPGALEHDRQLGEGPELRILSTQIGVASLTRTPAIGSVTVQTPETPVPLSLVQGRILGSTLFVTGTFIPPPPPPIRTLWPRTLLGTRRRARWD